MAGISASGHREERENEGDLSLDGNPQASMWNLEGYSSPKLIHYWRGEDGEAGEKPVGEEMISTDR